MHIISFKIKKTLIAICMKNWSFAQLRLRIASCEPSCERVLRLDLSLLFCLQKIVEFKTLKMASFTN